MGWLYSSLATTAKHLAGSPSLPSIHHCLATLLLLNSRIQKRLCPTSSIGQKGCGLYFWLHLGKLAAAMSCVNHSTMYWPDDDSIVLAFAGIHIYFASQFSLPFVIYYVCGLLIPIFFLVTSVLLIKEVNSNWMRTRYYTWRQQRQLKATTPPSTSTAVYLDEAVAHENMQPNKDIALTEQIPSQQVAISPPPPNPYTNKVSLHIHHWQIFYVLAFFTR